MVNIKLYDATWATDPQINIADQDIIIFFPFSRENRANNFRLKTKE